VRNLSVIVSLFLAFSMAGSVRAQQSGTSASRSYSPPSTSRDLIPGALEVYSSSAALSAGAFSDVSAVVATGRPETLSRPSALAWGVGSDDGGEGDGVSYLPVLFSALMPGMGELYLGYKWRGAGLMALEIAAWTGYFYYRNQGLDSRDAYEGFADQYWTQSKWIDHHPDVYPEDLSTPAQMDSVGREKAGSYEWPGYMIWVSKEDDKQHYYENLGKYDWFISGWADFDPEVYPFMTETALRDEYRAMRKQSNDQLETADTFIYVSLATRVFSIVETLFLVRMSGGDDDAGSGDPAGISQNQLRIRTRPRGWDGGEIALEYSFK
jgi:hypothetical protein